MADVRSTAISKALRTAVEEAAMRGTSRLSNRDFALHLTNRDIIRYIKAYRILNESFSEEEYKITLEVDVDSQKIKNKIDKVVIDYPALNTNLISEKPSLYISISETPESNPIVKILSYSDIEREMATILIGSGYRVVAESASDLKLETYIGIKTTESKLGEKTYNTLGYMYVRAKDRKGKVVTEVRDNSYVNGSSLANAGLEALKRAGASAARKIGFALNEKNDSSQKTELIEIKFSGLKNYIQYERIDEIMKNTVSDINIRSRVFKSGGTACFIVFSKRDLDELVEAVQTALSADLPLKIERNSNNIEFRVSY